MTRRTLWFGQSTADRYAMPSRRSKSSLAVLEGIARPETDGEQRDRIPRGSMEQDDAGIIRDVDGVLAWRHHCAAGRELKRDSGLGDGRLRIGREGKHTQRSQQAKLCSEIEYSCCRLLLSRDWLCWWPERRASPMRKQEAAPSTSGKLHRGMKDVFEDC